MKQVEEIYIGYPGNMHYIGKKAITQEEIVKKGFRVQFMGCDGLHIITSDVSPENCLNIANTLGITRNGV